jgi:hypothetical protein
MRRDTTLTGKERQSFDALAGAPRPAPPPPPVPLMSTGPLVQPHEQLLINLSKAPPYEC